MDNIQLVRGKNIRLDIEPSSWLMSLCEKRHQLLLAACSWGALLCLSRTVYAEIDFVQHVRPILEVRCFECHGAAQQSSSLRVDSKRELLEGGDSGPAIVPGEPEESYLFELISSEDLDLRMPPSDHGDALTAAEIELIRQWIADGAEGIDMEEPPSEVHWAFLPVNRPEVPTSTAGQKSSNAIDAFVEQRLREAGLTRSKAAEATTFIRRVTLDLTGLPPSPEEVTDFVAECEKGMPQGGLPDKAVLQLIDRLIQSPQYGERWAQHWLDVIRYADTSGYEKNKIRPNAWPYRDYVIDALNTDIPYPRFILEQLAGDQMGVDPATGFLVTHPFPEPIEVGQEPKLIAQVRFNGLDEVVQNVSSSMLGLTVGCARCHDHKFDPLSTKDYYRLAATFAGVDFAERKWDNGMLPTDRLAPIEARITDIREELKAHVCWREVEPTRVIEVFEPVVTSQVRMIISESSDKLYAPAMDEFQVWTTARDGLPTRNIATSDNGGTARSSGADQELGAADSLLNDNRQGESSLWVASHQPSKSEVWVEITLPREQSIDRVAWCQDRLHLSKDFIRLYKRRPTAYRIEVKDSDGKWTLVAGEPRSSASASGQDTTPDTMQQQRRAQLEDELAQLIKRSQELQSVFAGSFREPDPMHVLRRGDPQQPVASIGPGGIDVLGSYMLPASVSDSARRFALAEWLGSSSHPLTARVMVNRVWQHHFGTGIVATPSDFGTQGERPTHPELLDWLASDFMQHGWSLKRLHRQICTSATYRQSSAPDAQALRVDADSRLLWRFPPRRLEAEAIRDSILFVASALDDKAGGPGVNLYQSERYGSQYIPKEDPGEGPWRRSIYLLRVRGGDDGVFKAFDIPDCGQVRPKRLTSITPLQALNLFNSSFTQVLATRLADRVVQDVGEDCRLQVDRVFELTLCRPPSDNESSLCVKTARADGLQTVCRAILNSNEFLYLQ